MAYTSVKVTADSDTFRSSMKSAAEQMKVLSAQCSTAAATAKAFGTATDGLKAKTEALTQKITLQRNVVEMNVQQQEKLTKKLSDQKQKQEELRAKVEAARAAYEKSAKETGKNSEKSKELKAELEKLENEYRANESAIGKTESALNRQKIQTEKSKKSLVEMEEELKKTNKELKQNKLNQFATACDQAGKASEEFGKKMSLISAGVVGVGAASVKSYNEVKEGTDAVTTATGATGKALEDLKQSYKNIASSFSAEFGDIGSALGEVNTRFGFTGDEAEKCTKKFLEFARINNTDATTSVQLVSRAMGDAGIKSSDYGAVLDQLTVAAQASGIGIDKLAENITKYGAPMRALGMDTQESIAIFAGWEKAGVNTEIAFSGMKTAISNWSKQGKDAKVEFGNTLDEIAKCPDIASATTKAIEIFGKKAGPDLADAIKGGRFEYKDFLALIEGSNGTVETTYNNITDANDDAKEAMNNVKLAASDLGSTIMTGAAPVIKEFAGKIQDVSKWFTSLSDEQKRNVVTTGAIVAAVGPAAVGFGKVAKGISSTIKFGQSFVGFAGKIIAKITAKTAATVAGTTADGAATAATAAATTATTAHTAATTSATVATTAFGTAMKILGTIGVVAIITAIIAAIVLLIKNWDKVKETVTKLWKHIKDAFGNIKKNVIESVTKAKDATKKKFQDMGNDIKNSKIGKFASKVFSEAHDGIQKYMTKSVSTAKEKLGKIKSAYKEHGGGIKGIVAATMETAKQIQSSQYDAINKLTGGKLDKMVQKTKAGFGKAVTSIKEKWSTAKQNASKLASIAVGAVSGGIAKIKDVGKNLVQGLWNGISNAKAWVISKVKGFGADVLKGLKDFFGIHSPSKVMRDQVGKNIALGVAEGITKNSKNAKKSAEEMGKLIMSAAKSRLDDMKRHNKISLKQEVEYWKQIKDECKKGTKAREEADKKYVEAKKSLNKQLLKAEEDYKKKEKQINDDLKKDIKSLNDEYKKSVQERKNSILSSFQLFEKFDAGDAVSSDDLMQGMQSQVEALTEWRSQIAQLKGKLGDTSLVKAIEEMGVGNLNQVKALNAMTTEQLKEYQSLYNQRNKSAGNEAKIELESLRESTDEQIEKLTEKANKSIQKAQKEYEATCKKLGVSATKLSKTFAQQAEKPMVKSMKNITKNATRTFKEAVSTAKSGVKQLKNAMNFKWSLPKLAVPKINVSGGKSPYGIGGKGTVPSFDVKWNKNGGIMKKPIIFGFSGDKWLGGGEDGDEAILPLGEFYNRLSSLIDAKIGAGSQNTPVYVTAYTYIDGEEIASRTVTKVDEKMVRDRRKGRK